MTKQKGDYLVPFDNTGNLVHYAYYNSDVVMRENVAFEAKLRLKAKMVTGFSAKYVIWENVDTGVTYPMFIKDMIDLLLNSEVSQGETYKTHWRVQKRGSNYGIRLADADEIQR